MYVAGRYYNILSLPASLTPWNRRRQWQVFTLLQQKYVRQYYHYHHYGYDLSSHDGGDTFCQSLAFYKLPEKMTDVNFFKLRLTRVNSYDSSFPRAVSPSVIYWFVLLQLVGDPHVPVACPINARFGSCLGFLLASPWLQYPFVKKWLDPTGRLCFNVFINDSKFGNYTASARDYNSNFKYWWK